MTDELIEPHKVHDFTLAAHGDYLAVAGTCKTFQDVGFLIFALTQIQLTLPSHRKAVAGDFGLTEPAPSTYMELVQEMAL